MIQFTTSPLFSDIQTLYWLTQQGNNLNKSMVEDLYKSNRAIREGLVQVERMVNKPGVAPFQQKFWVKPDEVEKTDIVLRGHQNLAKYHESASGQSQHIEHYQSVKDPFEFVEDEEALDIMGRAERRTYDPETKESYVYEEGTPQYVKFTQNVGKNGRKAMYRYTYTGDRYINTLSRGQGEDFKKICQFYEGEDVSIEKSVKETQEFVKEMDHVISQYILDRDITVYRSIRHQDIEQFINAKDAIWQDKGYASTTVLKGSYNLDGSDDILEGLNYEEGMETSDSYFVEKDDGKPKIETRILIPKGKGRGAWMVPFSKYPAENEFLLARGTKFKITKIEKTGDNEYYIEMEAIGREVDNEPPKLILGSEMKKSHQSKKSTSSKGKQSNIRKFVWCPGDLVKVE